MESPRKSLWRSASWSTRTPTTKLRPNFNLPPLKVPAQELLFPDISTLADGDLSCVTEYLFLSGAAAASNLDLLCRRGITHIVNCAAFSCRDQFPQNFTYMTLFLRDQPNEDISSLRFDVFDFIEKARVSFNGTGRILFHCSKGTSRSVAFVVGYLMQKNSLSFEEALDLVRVSRPEVDPNPGFSDQLSRWRSDTSSPKKVYRMAPHSAFDPLTVVPKVGPAELDSRGAFLVESDDGRLFLWVGGNCESAMAEKGATAAEQFLRYKCAKGPLTFYTEGSEGEEFWVALGVCSEGIRRVESYDLDFEIYRRAMESESSSSEDSAPGSEFSNVKAQSLSPLLWQPLRRLPVEDGALEEEFYGTLLIKDDLYRV